ncbi:hypothetical protein Pmar_PMAR008327, partial [Perkinsus marinus ATCC 50983]
DLSMILILTLITILAIFQATQMRMRNSKGWQGGSCECICPALTLTLDLEGDRSARSPPVLPPHRGRL